MLKERPPVARVTMSDGGSWVSASFSSCLFLLDETELVSSSNPPWNTGLRLATPVVWSLSLVPRLLDVYTPAFTVFLDEQSSGTVHTFQCDSNTEVRIPGRLELK